MNDLPKYHQTFIPILEALQDEKVQKFSELREKVIKTHFLNLPEELLTQKLKSGGLVINNRLGWGKSYLKHAKMLNYPTRGHIQITKKGLEVLARGGLTLKELLSDPDVVAHNNKMKLQKEIKSDAVDIEVGDTPQELIENGFEQINLEVKNNLLEKLKGMNPYYFEKILLVLFQKMGYGDFLETPKSGDGGVDGSINQDHLGLEKIYIQAKRYADNKIREKDIRNFIGAMSGDTQKGIFVTTSVFDTKAIQKAKDANHTIILVDGDKLVDLMHKFGVGVQTKCTYELKEIDEDFFEEN